MHLSFSKETNVAPNRYVISSRYISNDISRRSEGQRQFVSVTLVSRRRNSFFFSLSLSFSLLLFIFRIILRLSFRSEVQSIKFKFIKVWKTSFCLILLLVLLCINISCSYVVALLISY